MSYKKCHVVFKKFFCFLFGKILSYLICIPNFKSINSSSLPRKKYGGDNFTPIPVSDYKVKIRW